jgi:hypothetical protein
MKNYQLTTNSKENKMNRFFLLFIAISILITVSCKDPFVPKDLAELKPSAGKGFLALSFDERGVGRTILPVEVPKSDDFTAYKLIITGTETRTLLRTNDDITDPIELEAGSYYMTVLAYMGCEIIDNELCCEENLVAKHENITFTIADGGGTEINIRLRLIITGVGEGTFSWNIHFTDGLDTSNITMSMIITDSDNQQVGPVLTELSFRNYIKSRVLQCKAGIDKTGRKRRQN